MSYFKPNERTAFFIDGPNLYATTRALGFDIDYKRLLAYFREQTDLLRAFYYTTVVDQEEFVSVRPLVDWLEYNSFTLVTKPVKEFIDQDGRRRVRGNMNIELTVDALELAPAIDHIVLVTGDGRFRSLISSLQRQGKRVSVISTLVSQPPMVADELRRQADQFIELSELEKFIGRDGAPARRPTTRTVRRPTVSASLETTDEVGGAPSANDDAHD